MSSQSYGLLVGVFAVLAFLVGVCARSIANLIDAIANRVRYGKQDPPTGPTPLRKVS